MITNIKKDASELTRKKLKELHQKEIFLFAKGNSIDSTSFDGVSRAEIRKKLNLSFPSVSALVDEMLESGLLTITGETQNCDRGRPGSLIKVNPDSFFVPIFELTGKGYIFKLFDASGSIRYNEFLTIKGISKQEDTQSYPTKEAFAEPIVTMLSQKCKGKNFSDILLILPGNINKNNIFMSSSINVVSPANFIDYIEDVSGHNVITINHADSFAFGERFYSDMPESYIYIYGSKTGVGAGVILDGQVLTGGSWRAGEIGHMSIDVRGRECICGSRGCLERYICTDSILEDSKKYIQKDRISFLDLCNEYKTGNAGVSNVIYEKAEILVTALNNIFSIYPVSDIVIGGELTLLGEKFLNTLKNLAENQISRMYRGRIKISYSNSKNTDASVGTFNNYMINYFHINMVLKK